MESSTSQAKNRVRRSTRLKLSQPTTISHRRLTSRLSSGRALLYHKTAKENQGHRGPAWLAEGKFRAALRPFFQSAPRSSLRLERQCVIATASEADGAKRDCRYPGGLFLRRLNLLFAARSNYDC